MQEIIILAKKLAKESGTKAHQAPIIRVRLCCYWTGYRKKSAGNIY